MVEPSEFQQIVHTQNRIVKLLRTYLFSLLWLTFIMTVWFLLRVTGNL